MKVFISHSQRDRKLAAELATQLKAAGFEPWNSESELFPGDNWALATGKALEKSDAMVVLVSRESMKSEWVRREIDFALVSQRYDGRLIPVILESQAEMPWIFQNLYSVNGMENRDEIGSRIIEELTRVGVSDSIG